MKVKVSLIGVGPGDIELISLKALDRIKDAKVIVYDNLIPAGILNYANLDAELIYAGKMDSRHHLTQDEINELLYIKSSEKERVVRLKGGDSYIFGRGAEEVEFLNKRGIEVEVISGVSSFYSAASSLGIPITHRDLASSFHVFTGHEKEGKISYLDYELIARLNGTLVFMMSVNNIDKIVNNLVKYGKNLDTGLSIISRGTRFDEERYDFTLKELLYIFENKSFDFTKIKKPALMIVGDVTKFDLRSKKKFIRRDNKLFGKKVLLTGTRNFCDKLSKELKILDFEPIALSLIEVIARKNDEISNYIYNIKNFTHIIFTSSNGVEIFFSYIKNINFDIRNLMNLKFVVLGKGTEQSLKKYGIFADFKSSTYNVESLAKNLLNELDLDSRVLIFRASLGDKVLNKIFSKNNIEHKDIALYDTKIDYRRKDELKRIIKEIDYIVVASSSVVDALNEFLDESEIELLDKKIISIGEYTTKKLEKNGFNVLFTSKESSIEGIVSGISKIEV